MCLEKLQKMAQELELLLSTVGSQMNLLASVLAIVATGGVNQLMEDLCLLSVILSNKIKS